MAQSKVNVHARNLRAANRTIGPISWEDDAEQLPEPQPEVVGLGEILRGEVELTTRTQGGSPAVIRIPHTILAALVAAILAMVTGGVWLVSSITEMKTNLATIQTNQREARTMQSANLKLMIAYTTNETNKVQFMTGLLTPTQQKQVFQWEQANPRPQLPNPDAIPEDERNRQ